MRRILGVLETALEGKKYLVGDKVTIADLSFVAWHSVIPVCIFLPFSFYWKKYRWRSHAGLWGKDSSDSVYSSCVWKTRNG